MEDTTFGTTTPFDEAVYQALVDSDGHALYEPKVLLSYTTDLADDECTEARVLATQCNPELLSIYQEADQTSAESVLDAAHKAELLLADERLVSPDAAHAAAYSLARGLIRYCQHRGTIPSDVDVSSLAAQSQSLPPISEAPSIAESAVESHVETRSLTPTSPTNVEKPADKVSQVKRKPAASAVSQVQSSKASKAPKKGGAGLVVVAILALAAVIFFMKGNGSTAGSAAEHKKEQVEETAQETSEDLSNSWEIPSDFPNPREGSFGVWEDGVYTSEALGLCITPNEVVKPDYSLVESSIPWDCAFSADAGSVTYYFSIQEETMLEGVDLSKLTINERPLEQVEFCGRTWWVFDYADDEGGDGQQYYQQVDGRIASFYMPYTEDEKVNEQILSAFSAI